MVTLLAIVAGVLLTVGVIANYRTDGTVITTYPNGTVITTYPNGTVVTSRPCKGAPQ